MNNCFWDEVFNEEEKTVLHDEAFVVGLISMLLGLWLNIVLIKSSSRLDYSYKNLANFTLAMFTRSFVSTVARLPYIKRLENAYGLEAECCIFFAFMETFLAVFEVECLTHVCIERYVVAKYITNGWTITRRHYCLFLSLCFIFAFTYSLPPVFGIGHYGYDFACTTCTLDIIVPHSWHKYLIVFIFMMRSVKSSAVMIIMLIWTKALERKYDDSVKSRELVRFTNCVIKVTVINLISWTPIAAIRGWLIASQIVSTQPVLMFPAFYIKWAMWISSAASTVTVVTLIIVDHRIRKMMLCRNKEDSLNINKND